MRLKHITMLLLGAALSLQASAQRQHGIGIHFGGYDFYGPQTDEYFITDQNRYTFNDAERNYDTSVGRTILWKPLVKFTYWWQVNPMLDLNLALSLASIDYPTGRPDQAFINRNRYNIAGEQNEKFLTELDARVNFNILPRERYIVSPYLFAGITASYHDIFFGANIPLGLGLNIRTARDLYLNLESGYKIAATDHDVNHLQHTVGFVYWFRPGYRAPAAEGSEVDLSPLRQATDADNDGVNDETDQCPSVAGTAALNGCPDSDNDGIADNTDQCPYAAGTAAMNGCPDTDSDGIADNTDQCPYVAGTAERNGCPIPDRDGDGFSDDADKCPDVYSKTNNGCPEIRTEIIQQVEKAAKAIFFETGKSAIRRNSHSSLDAIVRILKADPSLYADIEGHTDNVGNDQFNMDLSEQRANSVRDYFISKGISANRLTAEGFGETQPVATNETAAGKAQNRRTVIKLRNYPR